MNNRQITQLQKNTAFPHNLININSLSEIKTMKPLARQLKQMIWTVPVCLTLFSPLAAQALTVEKGTFDETKAVVTETSSVVASNTTSSEDSIYKSSNEALLAILILLGIPVGVLILALNSDRSSSSYRSGSGRSSSSGYSGYTGGGFGGGSTGGGGCSGGGGSSGGGCGGGSSGGGGCGGGF